MVLRLGLTEWVLRLSPLQALLILVLGCILVPQAGLVTFVLVSPDAITTEVLEAIWSAYVSVLGLVWLGYPVAVSIHLQRAFGERARAKTPIVIACFFSAMAAYLFAAGIMIAGSSEKWVGDETGSIGAFGLIFWFFGFVCPLYIISIAARGLVLAEKQCDLPSISIIVTSVMLWVLPLGVFSIQRRFRRLVATTEIVAAGP